MQMKSLLLPSKAKAIRGLAVSVLAFFSLALVAQAATTLSANIETAGTLAVTSLSTLTG